MESNEKELIGEIAGNSEDLYHRPAKLTRISAIANVISWVSLVVSSLIFIFFVVVGVLTIQSYGSFVALQFISSILPGFLIWLPGLFIFIVLQATAEGIYLLMDIEENTRKN